MKKKLPPVWVTFGSVGTGSGPVVFGFPHTAGTKYVPASDVRSAVREAVKRERERCARIAEEELDDRVAYEIRNGGKP